jgi:flagellar protein FliS
MSGYNNLNAYKNSVFSVDKVTQVIMLYDTAIASIHQAKIAIEEKDIQTRYNKLEKAFKILTGLRDALDHNAGGDFSSIMSDWYTGTAMRVISINTSCDINMCNLCIKHIKEMRTAWIEVQEKLSGKNASSSSDVSNSDYSNNGIVSASESAKQQDIQAQAINNFIEGLTKTAYSSQNFAKQSAIIV